VIAGKDVSLFGVPSSAGGYAPGQELAPSALRTLGLADRLTEKGLELHDCGDLPLQPWRPDRRNRYAQNLGQVIDYATRTSVTVASRIRAGDVVLVLGGDCTVGIGSLAGLKAVAEPRLVYFDMHADLNVPTSTADGALDWMGLAHALDNDEAIPALSSFAGVAPLLDPGQLVVLGYEESESTPFERNAIHQLGIVTIASGRVVEAPELAAERALASLPRDGLLAIHFDVDVIDFVDCPLSENTGRNRGVTLEAAERVLAALTADSRLAVITVTELNPVHAAADPGALSRFLDLLVCALAGGR
jgi:arginase